MRHYNPNEDDLVAFIIFVGVVILATVVLVSGCGTIPVTGPLTAISAGVAPEEVVRMETSGDGSVSGQVGAFTVKKRKGTAGTLLHFGLMALEGYGYYMLGSKLLEDDDGPDPMPVSGEQYGAVTVGDGSSVGRIDTIFGDVTLGAGVTAGDINTGPMPEAK